MKHTHIPKVLAYSTCFQIFSHLIPNLISLLCGMTQVWSPEPGPCADARGHGTAFVARGSAERDARETAASRSLLPCVEPYSRPSIGSDRGTIAGGDIRPFTGVRSISPALPRFLPCRLVPLVWIGTSCSRLQRPRCAVRALGPIALPSAEGAKAVPGELAVLDRGACVAGERAGRMRGLCVWEAWEIVWGVVSDVFII